ncbi:hypothetical protein [Spirosoma pollinicola]|uniref:Uncharacterized protein n=1 Tax=Spirosoma pollinicola TaxID=2057025 RepID=A0A2K8YZG8_9BACT|nr:hypothetical protein [Spirosoma pollinicola]AUD03027.1 hypothetical protein CWM47_15000 [Spirosoma pollinicola]
MDQRFFLPQRNLVLYLQAFCTVVSLSFLSACSSSTDKPVKTDEPVYTLIFLDKTRSVNVNKAFVGQKYQQAINEIIEQNIRQKGDKLEVYFIHENTSKARALNLTVRSEMDDVAAASPTDREAAETEFTMMLSREKAQIRQRVLQQLVAQNAGKSNQETDIWASLPVIAKANESGATVKVYYLSDMVESVKGSTRRDFQVTPPKNNTQADEWAKADAEQLKRYTIGSPEITMILPFEPNASIKENNPAVTQYWQTLFSELGAGTIEEQ